MAPWPLVCLEVNLCNAQGNCGAEGHVLVIFFGEYNLAWVSQANLLPWEQPEAEYKDLMARIASSAARKSRLSPPVPHGTAL